MVNRERRRMLDAGAATFLDRSSRATMKLSLPVAIDAFVGELAELVVMEAQHACGGFLEDVPSQELVLRRKESCVVEVGDLREQPCVHFATEDGRCRDERLRFGIETGEPRGDEL